MEIKSIDCNTLKKWLDNNEAVLVDVREPGEHQTQNIPQAYLFPLGSIKAEDLPAAEGKKLVFHCRSGKRSMAACEKLVAENPQLEVYNLEGGILEWCEQGHKTDSAGRTLLP